MIRLSIYFKFKCMKKENPKESFEQKVLKGLAECEIVLEPSLCNLRIGVAVSGGADSLSLLYALNSLSFAYNFSIFVINVNHNIRLLEETLADSEYVKNVCTELNKSNKNLFFEIKTIPQGKVLSVSKERKNGTEEAARFLRYEFFDSFIKERDLDCLCLAHNKNDQEETLLMRFLQGSTISAMSGIRKKRQKYVRPLLNISRSEIEAYLTQQNVSWRTDSTNFDNNYLRNNIRNNLVPFLNNFFEGWQTSVLKGAQKACLIQDFIEQECSKVKWQAVSQNCKSISFLEFESFAEIIRIQAIFNAFSLLGCNCRIPFSFVLDFEQKVMKCERSKEISVSISDFVLEYKDGKINVKKSSKIATESGFFAIIEEKGSFSFPFGTVTVCQKGKFAEIIFENSSATVKNIPFPFCIRSRQFGDFVKNSTGGKKSVSDIFSDWHIESELKNSVPLIQELVSDEQNILAVVGSIFGFKDWIVKN